MPSTAAQCYHLLRRQALMQKRKPLVVMTPKPWLYGCQQSWSRLRDLANEEFHPLLRETVDIDPAVVTSVIVTSGKVYYDIAAERVKGASPTVPILRVEELYPFPVSALRQELTRWPKLREVVWAQEEARNHGAWHLVRDQLESALPAGVALRYAGRPDAAATAVCDPARHAAERQELVAEALAE
jgi:2-oxoglutarate dehydrogenase E1 component